MESTDEMDELGFPLGVRLTHWFNLLFITLIARSGLAILAAHPKLYWNIDARPTVGRFRRSVIPQKVERAGYD